jgi:hypothetical protein
VLQQLLNGLVTLGVVSYHVRELRTVTLIAETRTEPRRGALEHFYRRTHSATSSPRSPATGWASHGAVPAGPG